MVRAPSTPVIIVVIHCTIFGRCHDDDDDYLVLDDTDALLKVSPLKKMVFWNNSFCLWATESEFFKQTAGERAASHINTYVITPPTETSWELAGD